jgi:MFS family permease
MRRQVQLTLLSILIVTVSTQPVFLLGAAFFQIGPELGLGPTGLGLLTAAFFLTSASSSAFLGRWVERVGWRRALQVNTLASGVLTAGAAYSRSATSLGAFLVAAAAIYGMSNPAANQALVTNTGRGRQATVFGIKHAGIPTSTLLAGLAVPLVVLRLGWRSTYLIAALASVALWLLVPRGDGERVPAVERLSDRSMPPRLLIGLAVASAFATVAASALGTFLVSSATAAGFSPAGAGWLQFAGAAASIVARVIYGVVADRTALDGFTAVTSLTLVGGVVFILLAGAAGPPFAALVVLAFATGWGWPGLLTFAVVDANRGSVASSSAITQAGIFFGAGVGPILLGATIERFSYAASFAVVALALAIASISIHVVGRRLRNPSGVNKSR